MTEFSRNTSLQALSSSHSALQSLAARIEGLFQALGHVSNEVSSPSPLWNAAVALQDELSERHSDLIKELDAMESNISKLNRGGQA
ncbi:hypothetical protein [Pseudovibrio sp. WM33]|uniref:hypothetical protein n=1 Tax=Pseudovibrio sp. WM33 TaxID=1735585 RepID=UPI0007AEE1B3|nr:hypothetical protein [Pseudovibrio sp. WM33]KZL28362.1 hypothetical protein PsWM33_00517 [Pseudovibrio sp. WM33]